MGRVLGSLCVVTARDGDAQSAMLASWISQARPGSFPTVMFQAGPVLAGVDAFPKGM